MHAFIITGPSSCGKTAVINRLAKLGYAVLHETAREIISEGKLSPRSAAFQEELATRHLEREIKLEQSGTELAFLDRGIYDANAFSRYFGVNEPTATKNDRKYTTAFFLEPLEKFERDGVRIEKNMAEALQIGNLIRREYETRGIRCIDVPKMDIEERVEFILRLANKFIANKIKVI